MLLIQGSWHSLFSLSPFAWLLIHAINPEGNHYGPRPDVVCLAEKFKALSGHQKTVGNMQSQTWGPDETNVYINWQLCKLDTAAQYCNVLPCCLRFERKKENFRRLTNLPNSADSALQVRSSQGRRKVRMPAEHWAQDEPVPGARRRCAQGQDLRRPGHLRQERQLGPAQMRRVPGGGRPQLRHVVPQRQAGGRAALEVVLAAAALEGHNEQHAQPQAGQPGGHGQLQLPPGQAEDGPHRAARPRRGERAEAARRRQRRAGGRRRPARLAPLRPRPLGRPALRQMIRRVRRRPRERCGITHTETDREQEREREKDKEKRIAISYVYMQPSTQRCCSQTSERTLARIHAYTHTHTHTITHSLTHTHTHTHTQRHTHTHTHTHTERHRHMVNV